MIELESIKAIYKCNNCNNDFDILKSHMVKGKYVFFCPYCFSKDYESYNELSKKTYTDIITKTLKKLPKPRNTFQEYKKMKNTVIKYKREKDINKKSIKSYKGFIHFFYDNSNFKIIPLIEINPYLYIKDLKKLYSLNLPYIYINNKPIFKVFIDNYCSNDYIVDTKNKAIKIIDSNINSDKKYKLNHLISKRIFSNLSFYLMCSMLFIVIILIEYLIFTLIIG